MPLSALTAGRRLRASEINAIITAVNNVTGLTTVSATDATSRTTTSTTFTGVMTPAGLCGVAFTGPPSGKVLIVFEVEIMNSGTNASACSPAVRTGTTVGSGTVQTAASFDTAVRNDDLHFVRCAGAVPIAGLTPGATYNVSLEQAVTAGTGTYARRAVQVVPQIA